MTNEQKYHIENNLLRPYKQKKTRLAILERKEGQSDKQEIKALQNHIWLVDSLLAGLDARQRYIVEMYYCEGYHISKVTDGFAVRFKPERQFSEVRLKQVKREALEKMAWMIWG